MSKTHIEYRWLESQAAGISQSRWERTWGRSEQEAANHIAGLVGGSCPVPGAYRPGRRGAVPVRDHIWRMPTGVSIETRVVDVDA